jgi:hypothetical protein
MDWLQELMREEGLEPQSSPNASLRSKLLSQAERMLSTLKTYKTEEELNDNGSKYWWAPQSIEGQRRIVMRAASKTVDGSATYVDNTLSAVTACIEKMKKVIELSKDEQWADEEERRKKK